MADGAIDLEDWTAALDIFKAPLSSPPIRAALRTELVRQAGLQEANLNEYTVDRWIANAGSFSAAKDDSTIWTSPRRPLWPGSSCRERRSTWRPGGAR
jgi:hypothetical protein